MEACRSIEALGDAAEAIHTFHLLCEKRERIGALAPRETSMLAFTLGLFEPLRVSSFCTYRDPVRLAVRRIGLLSAGTDCQVVDVVALTLRHVEVALHRAIPIGSRVRLAVHGSDEKWFRYRGCMLSRNTGTSRATIILLKPIESRPVREVEAKLTLIKNRSAARGSI